MALVHIPAPGHISRNAMPLTMALKCFYSHDMSERFFIIMQMAKRTFYSIHISMYNNQASAISLEE